MHRFKTAGWRVKKLSPENRLLNRVPPQANWQGSLVRERCHSRFLHNERALDIYLPPSYRRDNARRYPVLYMHDGNNLFYPEIAFAGVPWHVNTTLDKLIRHGLMDEIIVVGIHNTMGRNSEYTWTPMKHAWGSEGGHGAWYARFLTEEVKPLIDHRYRTLPGREHTGVMGSSLGGLITLYLGIYYPHVFSTLGVVSPSLWWGHGTSFHDARRMRLDMQIWLDMGTREGYSGTVARNMNVQLVRRMKHQLEQQGYIEGVNLAYLEDRGGKHNEYHWGRRLHLPLLFFYGKNPRMIMTPPR